MKKLLVLLFSILISINSYGEWTFITTNDRGDNYLIKITVDESVSVSSEPFAVATRIQPTIVSILPEVGTTFGETLITVKGTQFFGDLTILKFGGSLATDLVVKSNTELIAKTPLGLAGLVDVEVDNPG